MIKKEKDLAEAIMRGESRIEISSELASAVDKIKEPSAVVWQSVAAALVASAFFWAGAPALGLGLIVGLPAVLAICGGVGGVVFITLGADGTMCAFKLLMATKTMDVLTKLRDNYNLNDNTLTKK